MKMEQTECSEMSAYKIQMPGNYPEENIQHFQGLLISEKKSGYFTYRRTHIYGNITSNSFLSKEIFQTIVATKNKTLILF
jgi:hypothetical protein